MQHIPTLARRIEAHIAGLTIGQGIYTGQPFRLLGWEKKFLRGAFSQPDDAALSISRGGGKSTFIAAIATSTVGDGPLTASMAETLIVASSFDQGLLIWKYVLDFLRPVIEADKRRYRIQDSANRASITDRANGASITVKGSDPARLHGAAPRLLIYDEVAQWPRNLIDRMLAALTTSRGKIPGSKALWIGTRPATPDHPFSVALAGGTGYAQVHAARRTDPPFQRKTWKRANPGLDHLPDLEKMIRLEVKQAKIDPSALASFRALRLNMGVSDVHESLLLDADVWRGCEGDVPREGSYCLGLDLGSSSSMSAASAYWPTSGRLESIAAFPEHPTLVERGALDGVAGLYSKMFGRGELIQVGRYVSDIPMLLREVQARWGRPSAIVCDRWRVDELRGALEQAGFPFTQLVQRGMGYRDGGEDVRDFRRAMLSGQVVPVESLLLRSAMAEARTISDPAGNSKLAKAGDGSTRRARAKDDAAAAAILAVAEGVRRHRPNDGGELRLLSVI